jgi:transcriptional regulator with XRE-family HTH domain
VGQSTKQAGRRRARQSPEYQAELVRLQPYEAIARQVIRLRMDHNLSQEALARRVGTTKSAISRLESGHHAPTVATLHKVASAFDRQLVISFDAPVAVDPRRPMAANERAAPSTRSP